MKHLLLTKQIVKYQPLNRLFAIFIVIGRFIMEANEKAKKIYRQYMNLGVDDADRTAKQCTLIAVKEVIEQWDYIDTYLADDNGGLNPNLKYWYDVRTAVNAL